MKRTFRTEDLSLFAVVARNGGLAGAARETGISQPTLGRRMTALERDLGRHLFLRGARGYTLTMDGRALLDRVGGIEASERAVRNWQADASHPPVVRITAGIWTSRFLARSVKTYWKPGAKWVPAFLASNAVVDIARREADIGIRNRRPEQHWLAGRQLRKIEHGFYGLPDTPERFIALEESATSTATNNWLRERHGGQIHTTVSDARLGLDLARAGVGRILMPRFAGDAEPHIVPLSGPIEELTHHEWLVCHHEARHDPAIRDALDSIAAALTGGTTSP